MKVYVTVKAYADCMVRLCECYVYTKLRAIMMDEMRTFSTFFERSVQLRQELKVR